MWSLEQTSEVVNRFKKFWANTMASGRVGMVSRCVRMANKRCPRWLLQRDCVVVIDTIGTMAFTGATGWMPCITFGPAKTAVSTSCRATAARLPDLLVLGAIKRGDRGVAANLMGIRRWRARAFRWSSGHESSREALWGNKQVLGHNEKSSRGDSATPYITAPSQRRSAGMWLSTGHVGRF